MSTGLAVLALTAAALTHRTSQRAGHALIGLVALWSLAAALIFSGTVLTWLILPDADRGRQVRISMPVAPGRLPIDR